MRGKPALGPDAGTLPKLPVSFSSSPKDWRYFGGRALRPHFPGLAHDVGVRRKNRGERRRLGRRGDGERETDISPSLRAPDRRQSPGAPELEVNRPTPHLPVSQAQAGGWRWRYSLPPPPSEKRSEVHAAGKATRAGSGAGSGADKSAAGAGSGGEGGGRRGEGPRPLEGDPGEGARDRAQRRGGEVCAGFGADPGTAPCLWQPWRSFAAFPSSLLLPGILSCGGRGVAIRRQVRGFPPTPPASPPRVVPTAASAEGHPYPGAASTLPVRSLSSSLPFK